MSGIVGIINLDGAPVDRDLLERMTDFMSFRGPDAQETWIDGNVGFGHTMLRTTFEAETEKQPLTLDRKVWLTADARIDGRDELIAKLEGKLHRKLRIPTRSNGDSADSRIPNDAELILFSYEAWGEDCVKHLIGDFAFAIWDSRNRQLFCARDHFGVKPFYYAQVGNTFVFSNTLNCVRCHPEVSDTLNDVAVGDFLLFDSNQDPETTTFADILRIPPAHRLIWSVVARSVNCYWSLSLDTQVRHQRARDQVDRFTALLKTAVNDRMRTNRVGIAMSGGLDSTTVAAIAKQVLSEQSTSYTLKAHAIVWDRLIPDEERHYSRLATQNLGISLDYFVADKYRLYERWDQPELHRPEPVSEPQLALFVDYSRRLASSGRVVMTGWDGDAVLNESPKPYFRSLSRGLEFVRLFEKLAHYCLLERRVIPLSFRAKFRRLLKVNTAENVPEFPSWLDQDFIKQFELHNRWAQIMAAECPKHPIRPYCYRKLTSTADWADFFESKDPGVTLVQLEHRHPLIDLRVVDYALSLPPVPWCVDKRLLRVSMRNILPDAVRLRPKTPLAGWPYLELLGQSEAQWIDNFVPTVDLSRYVDTPAICRVFGEIDPWKAWINLRPLSLNYWLQNVAPVN